MKSIVCFRRDVLTRPKISPGPVLSFEIREFKMLSQDQLEIYYERHNLSLIARKTANTIRMEEPSRSAKPGPVNVVSKYPSKKMGLSIQAESHTNELAALYEWDHDEITHEFYDQPPRIKLKYMKSNGRPVTVLHTPDFFRIAEDFIGWVECKTEAELIKLAASHPERYCHDKDGKWICPPGEAYAAEFGLSYKLRSSAENDWTLIRNLVFLADYFDDHCPLPTDEERKLAKQIFEKAPWIKLIDLVREDVRLTSDVIYKLIVDGDLYFSIYNQLISDIEYAVIYRDQVAYDIHRLRHQSTSAMPRMEIASPIKLMAGEQLNWDGTAWRIDNVGKHAVFMRNQENRSVELDLSDIQAYIAEGKITGVVTDLSNALENEGLKIISSASPEEMKLAVERYQMLHSNELGEDFKPNRSLSSIKNYKKKFNESEKLYGNGLIGLFPQIHKRGNRNRKIDTEVVNIMEEVIRQKFLVSHQPKFISVYGEVVSRCEEKGLTAPSDKTVSAEIKKISQYDIELARSGKRAAYKHEHFYWRLDNEVPRHGERPFDIVHIDHTLLDIEIADKRYGKIHSRPWFSVMLDAYARKVIAVQLSFDEPSYRSCMMLIRDCVRRHGRVPRVIVVDGGAEFDSVYFETLLSHLKITKKSRARSKARFGSVMERFFGTTNSQLIHNLRGNTQATRQARQCVPSHDPRKHAAWTLETLTECLHQWIEQVYESNPHKSLGVSPSHAFNVGMQDFGMRNHTRVTYDRGFELLCLPTTKSGEAKVDNTRGVLINYLNYWCQELRDPLLHDKKVPVRYDPEDASRAFAYVHSKWVECQSEHADLFKGRSSKQIAIISQELKARNREMGRKQKVTAQLIATFMRDADLSEKAQRQIWRDEESKSISLPTITPAPDVVVPSVRKAISLEVYEDF